jgi:hypothetical protein
MKKILISMISFGLGAVALAAGDQETNAPLSLARAIDIALVNNPEADARGGRTGHS